MRQTVLLLVYLVLSGCAVAGESGGTRASSIAQSYPDAGTTLRRVTGQEMMDQPLLPQPGNIWAGVLPGTDASPTAAPAAVRDGDRPRAATALSQHGVPPIKPGTAVTGDANTAAAKRLPAPGKTARAVVNATNTEPARRPIGRKKIAAEAGTSHAGPVKASAKAAEEASSSGAAGSGERPMVQLAAAASAKQAVAAWRRLRRHDPGLTDGHEPAISAADVNGRHVWRLRAGGFSDIAAAQSFCSGLHAAQTECWVVPASASALR